MVKDQTSLFLDPSLKQRNICKQHPRQKGEALFAFEGIQLKVATCCVFVLITIAVQVKCMAVFSAGETVLCKIGESMCTVFYDGCLWFYFHCKKW